jgi:cysteinyl-tRNA synthetase
MHGAHLLVEGKKMSKTLGNFFTLRDLLAKGFSGREVRYLLLTAHYREQFNFTLDGLLSARAALARLDECLLKLREVAGDSQASADPNLISKFESALEDDLNVSGAWGSIFEWVREMNRLLAANELEPAAAARNLGAWNKINSVFGVGLEGSSEAPPEICALLEQRQSARKARDFKRADAIREELKSKGWIIDDTPSGPRLKRL